MQTTKTQVLRRSGLPRGAEFVVIQLATGDLGEEECMSIVHTLDGS